MNKEEKLDKLLELEKNLTLMFDSDVRVALALLEEIRKLNQKKMNKYKFYSLVDNHKETIVIFDAPNLEEAYLIASQMKQLPLEEFKKIFKIEQNNKI